MKNLKAFAIALLCVLCLSIYTAGSDETVVLSAPLPDLCVHKYLLFNPADDAETSAAQCMICNNRIVVHSIAAAANETEPADPTTCAHRYIRSEAPVDVRLENGAGDAAPKSFHQLYTYYRILCEFCGDSALACTVAPEMYQHTLVLIADVHVTDSELHTLLYQCDACGQYICDLVACHVYDEYGLGVCQRTIAEHQKK